MFPENLDTPEGPAPSLPPGSRLTLERNGENLVIGIPGSRSVVTLLTGLVTFGLLLCFMAMADVSWQTVHELGAEARAGKPAPFVIAIMTLLWVAACVVPVLVAFGHQQLVVTPQDFALRRLLGSHGIQSDRMSAALCMGPAHGQYKPSPRALMRDCLVLYDGNRTLNFADHLSAQERQWIVEVVEQETSRLRFAALRGG